MVYPQLARLAIFYNNRKFEIKSNHSFVSIVIVYIHCIRKLFAQHAKLGSALMATWHLIDDIQILHSKFLARDSAANIASGECKARSKASFSKREPWLMGLSRGNKPFSRRAACVSSSSLFSPIIDPLDNAKATKSDTFVSTKSDTRVE